MDSIWTIGSDTTFAYPPAAGNLDADVVVIGAGITGLTTALQLAEGGGRVVVLEAHRVGHGSTGGSTGNLYVTLSKGLSSVSKAWDDAAARDVVRSRREAVDAIEATAERFAIDCDFQRRPLYRLLGLDDAKLARALDEDQEALNRAGVTVNPVDEAELPFAMHSGFKLDDQAQFNPLHYVQGLAQAVAELGVTIHEHSPVREVDAGQGMVRTEAAEIRARHIVHATHTPKGVHEVQTRMVPYRERAVSARLDAGQQHPDGIFWLLDAFHSVRRYHHDGEDYLLVVGEKYKAGGHHTDGHRYQNLRDYLSRHYPGLGEFVHQWSAQQYTSPDTLPFIGRLHGQDNVYLATGFGADGLAWGTLAGRIIGDLILERDNPWHERFDARRLTPVKSAREAVKENVSVGTHMVKDHLGTDKLGQFDEVRPGEARVASLDGDKLAVRRDEAGTLTVLSAVCPHMKCIVHWNAAESSWDCPCHGSRFDPEGNVIEGPAYHPLARRDGGA